MTAKEKEQEREKDRKERERREYRRQIRDRVMNRYNNNRVNDDDDDDDEDENRHGNVMELSMKRKDYYYRHRQAEKKKKEEEEDYEEYYVDDDEEYDEEYEYYDVDDEDDDEDDDDDDATMDIKDQPKLYARGLDDFGFPASRQEFQREMEKEARDNNNNDDEDDDDDDYYGDFDDYDDEEDDEDDNNRRRRRRKKKKKKEEKDFELPTMTQSMLQPRRRNRPVAVAGSDQERRMHERYSQHTGIIKRYKPPRRIPDPYLEPTEVVELVLQALSNNNVPEKDFGVHVLYGFSSAASNVIASGISEESYADFLKHDDNYVSLFRSQSSAVAKKDVRDDRAYITANVVVGNGPMDYVPVRFALSLSTTDSYDKVWLIDSFSIRPENARRWD
eukprot:CAMPEP_0118676172 /NCGR_PEP_ID=MMETSP0800-20121206/1890_1 /TAXON_ID=210618 ORGANISM="Striatella unipunctata, Strain CCMP2910" /NCGR_SAMPLE_ID=MMETSP0800 /ASSEMBLY_ACC=CAM_ASM_000638 /LENGTH=388 /DNA_ID=CAMNT_0006571637 /DNA_START=29 /DNA_END=1198 /DNA_ORIENTATION=+